MGDCIFCKIANGEIPTDFVFESERVVAFNDLNPVAPVHVLIIPKEHFESVNDLDEKEACLFQDMTLAAKNIAESLGLKDNGYRLVINNGKEAGQEVGHLHMHLIGGRPMKWPPG
ncbi:MAG TPA: histidine triad nucleotide-binding protein [Clostridia bacterium]|nr:histidine triad nucleotide-binding protein [Clostridia bacterium]